MSKIWLPVPRFLDKYKVSDAGEVFSVRSDRILKGWKDSNGYWRTAFISDGVHETVYIHHVVCTVFNGLSPSRDHQALHSDDDRDHNSADNLYWGTAQDNADDRKRNGLISNAKLDWDKVREIRRLRLEGMNQYDLAALFEVNQPTISRVVLEQAWREPHGS